MNHRMTKREIQGFLQEAGMRPLKQLGQNFLINKGLAGRIARTVQKLPAPYIEIGPGTGALTRFFKKEDLGLLIERDRKQAAYWSRQGFSVFCGDALKYDAFPSSSVTLFGNLPYHLAGPLILKSASFKTVSNMVFMMQKEVALRVQSAAGSGKNYGILSVMAAVFWETSFEADAAPKDFWPVPKVSGRVLKFRRKKSGGAFPLLAAEEAEPFLRFLKRCFANRRKKLVKRLPAAMEIASPIPAAKAGALQCVAASAEARPRRTRAQKHAGAGGSAPSAAEAAAEHLLSRINKSPSVRAEELSPDEFVHLFRLLTGPSPPPPVCAP